jgi:predicted enzyme related to lactoylglutathione lyase
MHLLLLIQQTQERVEDLGGTTCSPKTPEGTNGWYMLFKDVAGNRFGIYQAKGVDG